MTTTKSKSTTTVKKATTPAKAKKTMATKSVPSTEFALFAPDATEVCVCGDFNNWNPAELKARKFKGGTWRKAVKLQPGRYEYLFIVDGQWWTDPANPNRIGNSFGSENSIIDIA